MTRGRHRDSGGTQHDERRDRVGRRNAEPRVAAAGKRADRWAGAVIVTLAIIGGALAGYLGEPKSWEKSAAPVAHSSPPIVQSQGRP